jgi:hypothetical protein
MPAAASRKIGLSLLLGGVFAVVVWRFLQPGSPLPKPTTVAQQDIVPASIIVTEFSPSIPPPSADELSPGDRQLSSYGSPETLPENDLLLLAQSVSNFLILAKQATDRPLSANDQWSATLLGKRLGHTPWLSEKSPVFDSQQRLIDRWQTPLFFHALGAKRWEIRSAGPDLRLWTADDLSQRTDNCSP